MLMLDSLDGSLDARVNNGNVNLLISQHQSVNIRVKSGVFALLFCHLCLFSPMFLCIGVIIVLCSLHKTQCDVHKFSKLRIIVGSLCDVTISSLNRHLYLDQNLVIVDDVV